MLTLILMFTEKYFNNLIMNNLKCVPAEKVYKFFILVNKIYKYV